MLKRLLLASTIFLYTANLATFPNLFKNVPKPIKTATHWAFSAGPTWAQAYNYVSLLSESQALSIFGTEKVDESIEKEIRSYLNEINFIKWKSIKIKLLKEDKRDFVLHAIICTDTVIFVHPDIYSILTPKNKKAVVTRAAIMIESHYLQQQALILSSIPLITHAASWLYTKIYNSLHDRLPHCVKENQAAKTLCSAHDYATTSWFSKLAINICLSTFYLKYKSIKADIKTVKKLRNAEGLLSYYRKIYDKKSSDAFLLSIIKEPSPTNRSKILKRLKTIKYKE